MKKERRIFHWCGGRGTPSDLAVYFICRTAKRETGQVLSKQGNRTWQKNFTNILISKCKEQIPVVERGMFGADMKVSLVNDGPFTIVLDSDRL